MPELAPLLAALTLALAGTPATVERDGVRIEATVEAQIYTWTVTNLGPRLVESFEVMMTATYLYTVPNGWTYEAGEGRETLFRAWTDNPSRRIEIGKSGIFTARVSSSGAVLGTAPARVGFGQGEHVEFDAVWAPKPKRRDMVVLVPAVLAVIGVLHVVIARSRRGASATA